MSLKLDYRSNNFQALTLTGRCFYYPQKNKRRSFNMTNVQRILIETKGIQLELSELEVYLQENGLNPSEEYNPNDKQKNN